MKFPFTNKSARFMQTIALIVVRRILYIPATAASKDAAAASSNTECRGLLPQRRSCCFTQLILCFQLLPLVAPSSSCNARTVRGREMACHSVSSCTKWHTH